MKWILALSTVVFLSVSANGTPTARVALSRGGPHARPIGRWYSRESRRHYCTGTLVHWRTVLTAKRCLLADTNDMLFEPYVVEGSSPKGANPVGVDSVVTSSQTDDWAIVRLREVPRDQNPNGYFFSFSTRNSTGHLKDGDLAKVVGYVDSFQSGGTLSERGSCAVSSLRSGSFRTDCDSSPGSPVIRHFPNVGGGWAIIGMTTSGTSAIASASFFDALERATRDERDPRGTNGPTAPPTP